MKFSIISSSDINQEGILRSYPEIRDYQYEAGPDVKYRYCRSGSIAINSLEELIEFMERVGEPLIISKETVMPIEGIPYEIEIYDSYRE